MKLIIIALLLIQTIQITQGQQVKYALAIHGGAGTIDRKEMSADQEKEYTNVLNKALEVGDSVLANGGTCLDAIEKAIKIMEDSPLFNAGKGAVFTHEGLVELDASIMEGNGLNAGAIAGVGDIKSQISVARKDSEK